LTVPLWREEPIGKHHDRAGFACGTVALDEYLRRYARQNHEAGTSKAFVSVPLDEPTKVLGYYTLSPGAIQYEHLPDDMRKRLARYDLGVYRLGRLAVVRAMQGAGLGTELLLAAADRAWAAAALAGGYALAIDAKDEDAATWYMKFGARRLLSDPLKLILPFAAVRR